MQALVDCQPRGSLCGLGGCAEVGRPEGTSAPGPGDRTLREDGILDVVHATGGDVADVAICSAVHQRRGLPDGPRPTGIKAAIDAGRYPGRGPHAVRGTMPSVDHSFIPGLELSQRFYHEAVRPVIHAHFGNLPYTAARVGTGSEVLGFDTARSADHEWGPRLQLFLHDDDADRHAMDIVTALSQELPKTFYGYPTHFVPTDNEHVRYMEVTDGPVFHRVEVTSLEVWLATNLGFDPREVVATLDWLATPTQILAEFTAGAVFHDEPGELTTARARLSWYPDQIWRYVLACQWQRISQEEAFVGRCGEVGDELGSAVVAARLIRDLMRLSLLMHRRYPPYSKWLGSAFTQLSCAATMTPALIAALAASTWQEREDHLATAYTAIATLHNELGLTEPLGPDTRPYYGRPFQVLHAERFSQALRTSISDPELRDLPPTGAVDQFADNTDLLTDRTATRAAVVVLNDPQSAPGP